ncbi:MAG: O-antigen ligase family protein [Pseudomonadota bacterium]
MLTRLRHAPLPIAILLLSFLCPTELSLYLGGLRLPPHRVAIIILIIPALWRIMSHPDTRFRTFDLFMLFFAVWMVHVYTLHGEEMAGLIYGTSVALESLGGYAIARAYIRDDVSYRGTLDAMVAACFLALVFALPETLLGAHFTHDFLQSVTGYVHPREIQYRFTLTRAYGVFDHPIHLGTFAATMFALLWFSGRAVKQRIKDCSISAITTFTALSSAPILCIFTQVIFIVWDRYTRNIKGRIWIMVCALLFIYFFVSMFATRSPVMIIATGFTIDSWTGFYRTQIWEWGMRNVVAHPWFGIGLADWERAWWMYSDSIDAYWLVIMVQTGIPSLMLLLVAIMSLVMGVTRRVPKRRDPAMTRAARGWIIALIALCLAACTVHFWNVSASYFFMILGLGGWLADPIPARYATRREAKRTARSNRKRRAGAVGRPHATPGAVAAPA